MNMNDTWYDMGFDADMSWMYDWKGKEKKMTSEEADEIIKTLDSSKDMEEIKEIINCDADAETKCKMISNILTAKPHYFKEQEPTNKIVQKAYEDGKKDGYVQAKLEQEPTVTSTNNSGEMIYPQVEGITPMVVEPIGDDYKYIKNISKPTGIEFIPGSFLAANLRCCFFCSSP